MERTVEEIREQIGGMDREAVLDLLDEENDREDGARIDVIELIDQRLTELDEAPPAAEANPLEMTVSELRQAVRQMERDDLRALAEYEANRPEEFGGPRPSALEAIEKRMAALDGEREPAPKDYKWPEGWPPEEDQLTRVDRGRETTIVTRSGQKLTFTGGPYPQGGPEPKPAPKPVNVDRSAMPPPEEILSKRETDDELIVVTRSGQKLRFPRA